MRLQGIKPAIAAAVSLLGAGAGAAAQQSPVRAGDEYVITRSYQTSQQGSDGSSGSSQGRDDLLERVIAVREAGLELEYDLPKETTAEDRAREWQFPARLMKPSSGPMQLLNEGEMESRVERWLKTGGWTREVCGRWIFTWNAFRIECDPKVVIKTIEAVDLRSLTLREGAEYSVAEALGPGKLARTASSASGAIYSVVMDIDPEAVRRARAESDVVVGEIMQKPVTLEAALQSRRSESTSGTVAVTFDTDSNGSVWRRTKVTKLLTKGQDGKSETDTATEIVVRRRATAPSARPQ